MSGKRSIVHCYLGGLSNFSLLWSTSIECCSITGLCVPVMLVTHLMNVFGLRICFPIDWDSSFRSLFSYCTVRLCRLSNARFEVFAYASGLNLYYMCIPYHNQSSTFSKAIWHLVIFSYFSNLRAIKRSKKNNGRGLLDSIQKQSSLIVVMQLIMVTELQLTWRWEGSWVEMVILICFICSGILYIYSLILVSYIQAEADCSQAIDLDKKVIYQPISTSQSPFWVVFGGCM